MLPSVKGKVAKAISLVVRKLPLGPGEKKKGKKIRKEKDTFLKAFSFEEFESGGFSRSQKGVWGGSWLGE